MSDVKELKIWGLGGNKFHPEEGCRLTLYNEDENGNETDSVVIHLGPKQVSGLIRALEPYKYIPTYEEVHGYKPVCPQGWEGCVYDPAYILHHYPEWYKELHGDKTPEEVAKEKCDPHDPYCYDDEDK